MCMPNVEMGEASMRFTTHGLKHITHICTQQQRSNPSVNVFMLRIGGDCGEYSTSHHVIGHAFLCAFYSM